MPVKLASTHDAFFKKSMQDKEIARDFFKAHIPKHIQIHMDFNHMNIHKESYIDKKLRSRYSDLLYEIRYKQKPGYIYVLAEHQSKPDKWMPLRLWQYMTLIWKQFIDENKKQTASLPLIYPLVFYHGKKSPYPYSMDFLDLFAESDLAKSILYHALPLIDTTIIDDDELSQHGKAALFELIQKHIFERDFMIFLKALLKKRLLETVSDSDYFQSVVYYLANKADINDLDTALDEMSNNLPEKEVDIMTMAEQLRKQGYEQGYEKARTMAEQLRKQGYEQGYEKARTMAEQLRKQGYEQGQQQGQLEERKLLARKLLKSGQSVAFVCELTELSEEELA